MTGNPLPCAASISALMCSSATHASAPHEVRQLLIDSRIGSGRKPQNAQLTSMMRSAGRLPNPARAPNPPAANAVLSRSVKNLFQIGSLIDLAPSNTPPHDGRQCSGLLSKSLTPALLAQYSQARQVSVE